MDRCLSDHSRNAKMRDMVSDDAIAHIEFLLTFESQDCHTKEAGPFRR